MGLFSRRKPVVASADPVKINTSGGSNKRRSNEQQQRAWIHYDRVPEMWFAHNYIANALKRIRFFPATQPDPSQPPIPLAPTDGAMGARANAEMDRLRDEDGSHGTFIHDAALQLAIPGEGYFANYDDEELGTEIFGVYSIDELIQRDGRWFLLDSEASTQGEQLPEDTLVNRFWRPHPRYRKRPDSAFFALRDTLDELMLLDRLYRSNARSQVPNGIWLVPEEAQLRERARSNRRPNQQPGQQGKLDPLVEAFLAYFQQTLEEEDSAGNVAPGVLKVKGDLIEKFKEFNFGRKFDSDTAARYDRVLKRAADGVDMPASIITGMAELNHWTAWQVDEDAFDSHLAPLVELICAANTKVFLGPALADVQGPGVEKVFTWYDAAALMSHPNKSSDADGAYDRFAISSETYRKVKGYGEDDAPDEAEVAKRIEISKEIRGAAIPGGDVGTGQPGAPQGARTITASVSPINELGLELARLDRDLRVQLQAACEGAVIRALEKAGAKMRRKVQGVDDLKAVVEGLKNEEVCRVLGQDVVRRYFATDDELIDDAVVPIIPVYTRLVSRVQRLVRSTASDYGDLDDNVEAKQEADRQRGAEILTLSIGATIARLLYSPAVAAPARGEIDDTFTVPAGVLRDALAAAGGAPTSSAVNQLTDAPEGGVATGATSMDIFVQIGLTPDGWQWVYGDGSRKTPFAGHEDLDGVQFLDWQDEALRVNEDDAWLNRDYYAPGDHLYCQCDFAPVMTETTDDDQLEPALSEA